MKTLTNNKEMLTLISNTDEIRILITDTTSHTASVKISKDDLYGMVRGNMLLEYSRQMVNGVSYMDITTEVTTRLTKR